MRDWQGGDSSHPATWRGGSFKKFLDGVFIALVGGHEMESFGVDGQIPNSLDFATEYLSSLHVVVR